MDYTKNYNLKKPSNEDFYNVEDFNSNVETVDNELKKLEKIIGSIEQKSFSFRGIVRNIDKINENGIYYIYGGDSTFPYPYGIVYFGKSLELCQEKSIIFLTTGNDDNMYRNNCRIDDTGKYIWLGWKRIASIHEIPNSNILINGDFQVWQRGTSFTLSSPYTYTADRWRFQKALGSNGNVSKIVGGIRVQTTQGTLIARQYIEGNFFGKKLTISMKANGDLVKATGIAGEIPVLSPTIAGGLADCYFIIENGYLVVGINFYIKTVDIEYIKIELGEIVTPLIHRAYSEEKVLCERYCRKLVGRYPISYYNADNIYFCCNEILNMRVSPSIVGTPTEPNFQIFDINQGVAQSGFKLSTDSISIVSTKANHRLINAGLGIWDQVLLDAEIY